MERMLLLRKWLAVGIILLFVGTCFISAMAQDTEKPLPVSRGNWLYVGGDGPGNYTKIQDAIDNASDGDLVFVYDDSSPYYEHIIIDKSITLIGEDRNTTIINGNNGGSIVKIIDDYILVKNLSIINSAEEGVLIVNSSCNEIQSCIISNNHVGVSNNRDCLGYSDRNRIMNNLLINNLYGILLFDNYFSIISENILVNNSCAIQIDTTEKPMNTLGISQWPTYITVSNNHITDSKIAITIEDASLNVIKNNTIDNNEQGVFIYGTYGWGCDNTLERNYISNNDLGIDMLSGIMGGASGNKFYQNTFLKNTRNVRFALYDDNNWEQNYWGRARFIPYLIFGWKHPRNVLGDIFLNLKIPWIEIDWHPAQEPYDIP